MIGLAYCDRRANIYFDERVEPLADGGVIRHVARDEVIPAPPGCIPMILPGRRPLSTRGAVHADRFALAVALPAGYTRLLVPAYHKEDKAPALPLFGYTFACVVDDALHVAAMRTDEREDWSPRYGASETLESAIVARLASEPANRVLSQVALCSRDYGCFTAQNVFLAQGEAALPVSPKCNARCVGCISELPPESKVPAPQVRIGFEASSEDLARVAVNHLERVADGIVSFGQGCEGEPLLRSPTIARAIQAIRKQRPNGTINLNTNGSMPSALERCIDAGLQAVRVSLNSFRAQIYAAYYRPLGYGLEDVFASIRLASSRGLRVSLNLLTHPGVSDDEPEMEAMRAFLSSTRIDLIQTRTLNIDPEWYFGAVGRPQKPIGMRYAIAQIQSCGVAVGNFTHTH
ncbi:MAG: radical SAM protein [Vulcanimicrobiaceae bacterium]